MALEFQNELETISDEEKQIAEQATNFYTEGDLDEARKQLDQLQQLRPDDIKVAHNKILITQSDNRLAMLKKLFQQCIDNDEMDPSIVFMNTVLLHFKAQKYQETHHLLEKLLPFFATLSDSLVRDLLFLCIECCFKLNYPEKVPSLIAKIDTLLFNKASPRNGSPSTHENSSIDESNVEYKPLVNQCRVRCLLALRSLRVCKREVKNLNVEDREKNDKDCISVVVSAFLRAQLEHFRDNEKKAAKILNTLQGKQVLAKNQLATMYYNNMSCVTFKAGRRSLALTYARRALQEYDRQIRDGEPHRQRLLHDLLYNQSVCKLFTGNYQAAFNNLLKCLRLQPQNPQLWLRLAECSIMIHEEKSKHGMKLTNMVKTTIGQGRYKRLLLAEPPILQTDNRDSLKDIKPSILFAERSLRVCLSLIDELTKRCGEMKSTNDDPPCATQKQNLEQMKASAHCALAYVALCIGDYYEAQDQCTLLFDQNTTEIQKTLSRLYRAEALLMQDKFQEAIKLLTLKRDTKLSFSYQTTSDNESESQWSSPPDIPWLPSSNTAGRNIFLYNLAVAHTLREEFRKAEEIVEMLMNDNDHTPHVVWLALYLQLQQGRTEAAKRIISRHLPLIA